MNKQELKNAAKNDKKQILKVKADFSYLTAFNYKITKQIGRGGYGVVYKAHEINNDNHLCAIKINFNTVSRQLIYAEMAFLMIVKNKPRLPNLVNLFVYHDITHIVLEYFKYKPFITFFNTMGVEDIKHYTYELLLGLKQLKNIGIYHRDIKPGNFLYNPQQKRGVIIDFGLAQIDPAFKNQLQKKLIKMRQIKHPEIAKYEKTAKLYKKLTECLKIIGRNKIGTQTYMPIQSILHHPNQSYKSDLWPVGVILLQFVVRKYNVFNSVRVLNKPHGIKNTYYISYLLQLAAFFGSQAVIQECRKLSYDVQLPNDIDKISFKQVSCIQGFDDKFQDILTRLLTLDYRQRISVQEALQHPFFNDIKQEHKYY